MAIQMNECGAQGTFGEDGKIFQASFAGRVANNLVGKWSLEGEEGTFNIQIQNNEKDCASFDGMMYSGDKKWKWTGHKEAISASNANPSDSTPSVPSGSASAVGSQEGPQLLVTNSGGTSSLKQGGIIQSKVTASDPIVLQLKCTDLKAEMDLMTLMWYHEDDDEKLTENEMGFLRIHLILFETWKKLCLGETRVDYDTAASSKTGESPIEIRTELQQGPIRAEVVNDQVSLHIVTPDVIVSSQGKNTFSVAYDPESGKSFVAASQYPIQVQLTDGSQAPFILESGQKVEVGNGQVTQLSSPFGQVPGEEKSNNPSYVPKGSEGGCYADPVTGEIVCVDSSGKPSDQQGTQVRGTHGEGAQSEETQDLCFEDPDTHEIICTDSGGEPSNNQEGLQGGCYQDPVTRQYVCIN
jgi:uncharacterized protein (DUF2147 family)